MAGASKVTKKRMVTLFFLFLLGIAILIARLVYLQIIAGPELKIAAVEQQTRDEKVASKRGTIFDCNYTVLAQSATCETVTINPKAIEAAKNGDAVKAALIEVLGVDGESVDARLAQTNMQSVIIKRKVDKSVADTLREKNIRGINFEEDSKRYYPLSNFASHVIGFTGNDNNGLEGIEQRLESVLGGTAGRVMVAKDVRNIDMPFEYENYQEAQDGQNVVLTIDSVLQHYVEKHLQTAYEENDVQNGAAAILMDPKTGAILAMSVKPDYDLNDPFVVDSAAIEGLEGDARLEAINAIYAKRWRNKAVVDAYEPGSTFKIVTAAAALESGVVSTADSFVCNGYRIVAGRRIHCHKRAGHGAETFARGVENSCNPVFMDIAARMGNDTFYQFYKAFGFTEKTGFLLPGESSGTFYAEGSFNELELATASFGQGPTITPLQLVCAVSAVVNGGNLMEPQIVKCYTDSDGNITKTFEPKVVRQVISESTSSIMRTILEGVVSNGTGSGAYVEGYQIGGKTGTSEKLPRGSNKKTASFVGFAPVDDPQLVCLVILDEPGGALTGGGAIAAPVVGKIMEDSLRYMGFEPSGAAAMSVQSTVTVPEMRNMSVAQAQQAAKNASLSCSVKGSGETVLNQIPKPGATLTANSTVILYTSQTAELNVSVPSVLGQSFEEARSTITNASLNFTAAGGAAQAAEDSSLVAVAQTPSVGATVPQGTIVYVDFADNNVE